MSVYVERTAGPGSPLRGVYANAQEGIPIEVLDDAHPDVVAFKAKRLPGTPENDQQERDGAKAVLDRLEALSRLERATDELIVKRLNLIHQQVVGIQTAVWDPASMANATGVTSPAVTVTGAAFGDVVDVAAPYDLVGIVATAYVSAVNTVRVRLHNGTGGAVNLASGTWKVVVRRPLALPTLDKATVIAAVKTEIDNNA